MERKLSLSELVGEVRQCRTVALGGGGLQRKPMAAVHAIANAGIRDMDLISFLGGPDVDLLIGLGLVRRLSFAFVGFDAYGLAPNFRKARETGALQIVEYTEGLMLAAFEAAAKRLPFVPTRFGLGTDVLKTSTSPFKTFDCPLSGETLVAVPPLAPEVAIVHVNEADRWGNAIVQGDAFADSLLVRASKKVFLTAERIVEELPRNPPARSTFISRLWVTGVVEAPRGAGMTALFPDYRFDLPGLLEYQHRAIDRAWLGSFVSRAR